MMDVRYFIKKFEAIPEEKWCTYALTNNNGACCANGHCGVTLHNDHEVHYVTLTQESKALQKVFSRLVVHSSWGDVIGDTHFGKDYSNIAAVINNGNASEYQQETPKQRILAALRDLETNEELDKHVEAAQAILNQPTKIEVDIESALAPATVCFVGLTMFMGWLSSLFAT